MSSTSQVSAGLVLLSLTVPGYLRGQGISQPCETRELQPDGVKGVQSRLLPVGIERAKELAIDSMLILGFVVTEEHANGLEATRKFPELGGPSNTVGEKLFVRFEEVTDTEAAGTRVYMESGKRAFLHKRWAVTLLDQAECLYRLLDLDIDGAELWSPSTPIQVPHGTLVNLRLRRYLFSKTARTGDEVALQTSTEVVVDGRTVIRKGARAAGRIEDVTRARGFGRGAGLALSVESVEAVDGTLITLRPHDTEVQGKSNVAGTIFTAGVFGGFLRGDQVGIRAGTEVVAAVASNDEN